MKTKYPLTLVILAVLVILIPWRVRVISVASIHQISLQGNAAQAQEYESDESGSENDRLPASTNRAVLPVNNNSAVNTATNQAVTPTPVIQAPQTNTNATQKTTSADTTAAPVVRLQSTIFPWAWVINRSAGIASYLLLALLTITGISLTTGLLFRIFSPAIAWSIHRAIGSVLLVSVLIHVFSLLFDSFMGLRIFDLLIPFVSPYRPLLVSFGIVGFYLLLLLLATSLYTMTKYARFWRTVHFFAFPMFVLIFLHGTLIGTDRQQPWLVAMYWSTAILVVSFVVYRLVWKYRKTTS